MKFLTVSDRKWYATSKKMWLHMFPTALWINLKWSLEPSQRRIFSEIIAWADTHAGGLRQNNHFLSRSSHMEFRRIIHTLMNSIEVIISPQELCFTLRVKCTFGDCYWSLLLDCGLNTGSTGLLSFSRVITVVQSALNWNGQGWRQEELGAMSWTLFQLMPGAVDG